MPEANPTIRVDHIKGHYYMSHPSVNPTRIVPAGPISIFTAPHGRERLLPRDSPTSCPAPETGRGKGMR